MFCFQCQEAAKGIGCTVKGVCGKDSDVANLQDTLLFVLKGVAALNSELRKAGLAEAKVNKVIFDGLFSTITNANFDEVAFSIRIKKTLKVRDELRAKAEANGIALPMHESVTWTAVTTEEFEAKAAEVGILSEKNEDIRSLKELIIYGLKGLAAYAEHAYNLNFEKEEIYAFMERALAATTQDLSADELVALTLETGKFGVDVMALLDQANTTAYGNPEMTKVNIGVRKNPAILISGHDLKDMEELLIQSEGTGVDIYTHSEMLPANYYPAFKKYKHLAGNYGNAWWKQKEEFESFNGPILFTTNCIVPPMKGASYADRIYTTGASGLPGAVHIADRKPGEMKNFRPIIEHVSLRQKAKEKLKKGNAAKDSSQTSGTKLPQSEDEYMKLLHEFQISQIELELQYEKLRQALDRAETATALYDFAPVGFFTLAADGLIDQLNATAASLLSDDRSSLKNSNFRQFISPVDHPVFDAFLQKIFGSNFRQSCEVRIILKRNPSLLVRLEGIISENEQKCVVSAVDITESKRAEETIKKSEANLISVLNNRDESIWSIDRNYNLIVFNNFFRDEYFASFNIELKQGMNVLNILSPKLREFWKPKYDKALSGRKLSFEYSNQVGNELHFYEVFLNPIKSNGKITGVSALSIVVTNQKQAEAALRFSESKYRKLLESMRDGFAYVNMIGVIRESNESFRRMLGYSSEELSHLTYNDITPEKWHDYENKILVEQIFARGYSEVYEKEYIKKDGTVFPVELSATLVKNELGKNEGIWAVVRDITERKLVEKTLKEAEIKFRTIFNFASDGFLGAWVDSHKLSTANSKICEMLGYTEEELMDP